MTGQQDIRSIITKNLSDAGFSLGQDGLRVQPDPFSGWRIVVISAEFEGYGPKRWREEKCLKIKRTQLSFRQN